MRKQLGTRKVEQGLRTPVEVLQARLAKAEKINMELSQKIEGLHETEAKYRTLFLSSAVGISISDMNKRILETNPAFQKMLGYSAEELNGKLIKEVSHPDDFDFNMVFFDEMVSGKRNFYQLEKRYIRKDGKIIWARLTVSHIRNAGGSEHYAVAMMEDITEAKQAEEALRKSEELFKQAQKMEAIGRFTSGIAHDFNNLLTGILGYSGLIKNRLENGHPLMVHVEEIWKAAERGAMLTDQLLAISRRKTPAPILLDLNQIIGDLDGLLRRVIDEDIELVTDLANDLGAILADPSQMEQVIMNIVVNARDAMPKGGKLTIRTCELQIENDGVNEDFKVEAGQYVMLTVSDTGVGIDADTLPHIFEPFFTTKDTEMGTGLGLFTVYRIVRQSCGYIDVMSEPQDGTTFRILIPKAKGQVQPIGTHEQYSGSFLGTETVLVVEDDESVRKPACEVLQMKGYKVLAADNGEEAFHLAEKFKGRIHLLIADIIMPNVSGPDLAQKLMDQRSDIKVLFMSGYTRKAIEQMKILDPQVPFLIKPFSPNVLLHKVREVLDQVIRNMPQS